jgi:hypothetical protein
MQMSLPVTSERISYSATSFWKRLLPLFISVVYLALILAMVAASTQQPWDNLRPLAFVGTGIGVFATLVWWFCFGRVCDEVWDEGSALVVRNREIKERIELIDIVDVRCNYAFRPEQLTLGLRRPCRLGSQIRFLIPYRHFPWGPPPLYTSLVARIADAQANISTTAKAAE